MPAKGESQRGETVCPKTRRNAIRARRLRSANGYELDGDLESVPIRLRSRRDAPPPLTLTVHRPQTKIRSITLGIRKIAGDARISILCRHEHGRRRRSARRGKSGLVRREFVVEWFGQSHTEWGRSHWRTILVGRIRLSHYGLMIG
jgi:hypothetical protein